MTGIFINQVPCSQAEYAVLGTCEPYGAGIISWHTNIFDANRTCTNLRKLGGKVETIKTPKGNLEQHKNKLHKLIGIQQ